MFGTCILLISQLLCVQSYADYYWRDYDGSIPPDAIPADDNNNSYIGQVYVHHYGLMVGTLIPGSNEIEVAWYDVKKIDIIKVMCAKDHSKFIWLTTSADTFKKDLGGKTPIVSGYDRKYWENTGLKGELNIGRTHRNGRVIIGNVLTYDTDAGLFYFPWYGKELRYLRSTQYEVLVYYELPSKNYISPGSKKWTIL